MRWLVSFVAREAIEMKDWKSQIHWLWGLSPGAQLMIPSHGKATPFDIRQSAQDNHIAKQISHRLAGIGGEHAAYMSCRGYCVDHTSWIDWTILVLGRIDVVAENCDGEEASHEPGVHHFLVV